MKSSCANYGVNFAASVKSYLDANNLKSLGAINGAILGELSQRFYDHHEEQKRLRKKRLSEEEWFQGLCSDPIYKAINVPQERELAKRWYAKNSRVCTRRCFEDWIDRALRSAPVLQRVGPGEENPVNGSTAPHKVDLYTEPSADWRRYIAEKWPRQDYPHRDPWEEGRWLDVPLTRRQEIIKAL